MPRPKVRPEDRRRSVRACLACKNLKKRCDSKLPCSPCTKKGIADTCQYTSQNSRKRSISSPTSPAQPQRPLPGGQGIHPVPSNNVRPERATPQHDFKREVPQNTRDNSHFVGQKSVMLLSSSGEKVFVGNTAALSFHQFLRKILKRYVGPSSFTEGQQSRRMLEAEVPTVQTGPFKDELEDEEKQALIQCFLDASCGLLDLFSEHEIEQIVLLARRGQEHGLSSITGTQREDLASLYVMISIGAQCRGRDDADAESAAKYFTQARQMAFESMLQDPTTNMARAFLLMAYFMLGACRRNAAFMFIGVASKAAVVLGLHVSGHYKYLGAEERDMRLRIGKSIRALDLVCSSILGRPGSTLSLRADDVYASDIHPISGHRAVALSATYEASTVLESIVHKAAQDSNMDTDSAENFLQMLREWSQALPVGLRQRPPKDQSSLGSTYREASIGNIHVACTYYFGVILTTRHFLIQHTTPLLQKKPLHQSGFRGRSFLSEESDKVAEMAHVCIDAATYMAQMCSQAAEAGVLLGNMCILKAWIFAAGLVLGFCLLSDESSSAQARDAFDGTRRVLLRLGKLSPQAAQYHEILTSFSEAIDTYRAKLAREIIQTKTAYVERILSLDPSDSSSGKQNATSTTMDGVDPMFNDSGAQENGFTPTSVADSLGSQGVLDFPGPSGEDEIMLNLLWDGYAINFGDSLPWVDEGNQSPKA